MALTHAFQLAKGQSLDLHTDSKYAFHIPVTCGHLEGAWTTLIPPLGNF